MNLTLLLWLCMKQKYSSEFYGTCLGSHVGRCCHQRCFVCKRDCMKQSDNMLMGTEVGSRRLTGTCRRRLVGVLDVEELALRAFSMSWSSWSSFIMSSTMESSRALSRSSFLSWGTEHVVMNLRGHFLEILRSALFLNVTKRTLNNRQSSTEGERKVLFCTINRLFIGKILANCQESIWNAYEIHTLWIKAQGKGSTTSMHTDTYVRSSNKLFLGKVILLLSRTNHTVTY